jgi:hypothetical protein
MDDIVTLLINLITAKVDQAQATGSTQGPFLAAQVAEQRLRAALSNLNVPTQ